MNPVAKRLGDADIDNLAAYWSAQPDGSDLVIPDAVSPIRNSKMRFPADFPKGFAVYNKLFNAQDNTVGLSYVNAVASSWWSCIRLNWTPKNSLPAMPMATTY